MYSVCFICCYIVLQKVLLVYTTFFKLKAKHLLYSSHNKRIEPFQAAVVKWKKKKTNLTLGQNQIDPMIFFIWN